MNIKPPALQPPNTFPFFQKLPTELRLMIWNLVPTPRQQTLTWTPTQRGLGDLAPMPPPPLLSVNTESRTLALKYYELWNICQRSKSCRHHSMRFETTLYPFPHDGGDEAYAGRWHRYFTRLEGCRCFPYVWWKEDEFVVVVGGEWWRAFVLRVWRMGEGECGRVRQLRVRGWPRAGGGLVLLLRGFRGLEGLVVEVRRELRAEVERRTGVRLVIEKCKRVEGWRVPRVVIQEIP
ncbi:hypothetical protein GLAREA_07358 [Glarea lozoyensis ATCC 20868]|uniref:2EXR domain-containing protein n=1 Tax=Glarea lozoyensis (strain ATCC 20868 / MF5171) TaxID=1116229 RepID=S3D351_GLAL2|nr:uncharacterized protein GLAREA_07358 [Glarea lozoyensis ATCC 20868]EPE32225.1 hypothetical protein GLAREA_07358 [Glarea lozoyensis ATCC 20868]